MLHVMSWRTSISTGTHREPPPRQACTTAVSSPRRQVQAGRGRLFSVGYIDFADGNVLPEGVPFCVQISRRRLAVDSLSRPTTFADASFPGNLPLSIETSYCRILTAVAREFINNGDCSRRGVRLGALTLLTSKTEWLLKYILECPAQRALYLTILF